MDMMRLSAGGFYVNAVVGFLLKVLLLLYVAFSDKPFYCISHFIAKKFLFMKEYSLFVTTWPW